MSLKNRFIIFIIIIHSVEIGLAVALFETHKMLFVISEVFIVLSLAVSLGFYRSFLRPHRLLNAGIESLKDQDFSIKIRKVGQQDLDQLITVFNKIMDQLRMERTQLSEKNFFLDKLVSSSSSGILILDFNQQVAVLNNAAQTFLGGAEEEIVGKSLHALDHPLVKDLAGMKIGEHRVVQIDGMRMYKCTKLSFQEKGTERIFFHIDELTEELMKVERTSYERIIRVMAHEVNNTLGAVNSILSTTLRYEEPLRQLTSDHLIDALKAAKTRNTRLNEFMKNYAEVVKLPAPVKEEINLSELLHRMRLLFEEQTKNRSISWEQHLSYEPVMVALDVHQIEMVLINILKNAMEAIGEQGTIAVHLISNILEIKNNGQPITDEEQERIFEAFYTSKPQGQGIGLTLTKDILINHGFTFSLRTNEDGITVFKIDFSSR